MGSYSRGHEQALDRTSCTQILRLLGRGHRSAPSSGSRARARTPIVKLLEDAGEASPHITTDVPKRNLLSGSSRRDLGVLLRKERNVAGGKRAPEGAATCGRGSRIDADTKLIPSYLRGRPRDATMRSISSAIFVRLATRVQLTRTGTGPIWKRSRPPSAPTRLCAALKSTAMSAPAQGATARAMHRGREAPLWMAPPTRARLHVLRRAPEPHDADGDAPVHAPDQRRSRRRSRTTRTRSRSTSCTTTS